MKHRVTVIRTVVVECSAEDAKKIAWGASLARHANPDIRLLVEIQTLLDEPERRVVLLADNLNYEHGDYESEEDRLDVERQIRQYGVWGFSCQQRTVLKGEWDTVDSCFGFIGNDGMLDGMREQMPEEFRALEPINEYDAEDSDP